jgi:hypothetical protein
MPRSPLTLTLAALITAVLVAVLGASHWRLNRRVAALEMVAARSLVTQGEPGTASTSDVAAIEKAVAVWRDARAGEGAMTEDQAAALVEAAVDDAIERKADERKNEEVDRYMKMAEESMRVEVEDLGTKFNLGEEKVNQVVDLLVQGMYEGHELREDIKAGTISMREAKEEGEVIKQEYADALTELLGEEAYEELGRSFYGEGGWESAR